jgi:hypothetical protein
MKIRNGFISNSSSTSFCIVITKKDYDKVKTQLNAFEKLVLSNYVKDVDFLGTKCKFFSGFISSDDGFYDINDKYVPEEYKYSYPMDIIDKFIENVEKLNIDHVYERTGY